MFSSACKLLALAMAVFGPFFAGVMYHLVRQPEVYAFFLAFGIMLGLAGILGFASFERDERRRHQAHMAIGRGFWRTGSEG